MPKWLILTGAVVILMASCRKETENKFPEVFIDSPYENQQFNVFDTIHVHVRMTDDVGLTTLKVQLLDLNMIPVLPQFMQSLSGVSQDISFDYVINNIRITSGNYVLSVEAHDASDYRRIYKTVYVTEAPLELQGFFVVTNTTPNVRIYKCDSSFNPAIWDQSVTDFTDMALSSYWQQVYINGQLTGSLRALSIDGSLPNWSLPAFPSTMPYWGPLSTNGLRLLISCPGPGQIRQLDESGNQEFFANTTNGFYPDHHLQVDNRIYVEQKEISSAAKKIVVYNVAGAAMQETNLTLDALAMFQKDNDQIYVIGNEAGQGSLLIYDFIMNGFWEPITLPAGSVLSAAQISGEILLIAMSNGNVYKFNYNPISLMIWGTGINPAQLRYDATSGSVISAEGSNVRIYNFNPFMLEQTIPFPDPVADLELWYNR